MYHSRSTDNQSERAVTPSGERALDVDEAELHELLASGYGIFAGRAQATAVLRFSARAARWVADEEWHARQRGTWLPGGRYRLEQAS